jgi:hypothetical protein
MKMLKIGGFYFAVVFAVGFLLGTIRVLLVVPRLGARMSELIEAPFMLAVSVVAARWLVRRYREITAPEFWLGIGLVGLALLLLVEFTVVLWIRGLSIEEYFATRDPVSSAVYFALLGAFAVLPTLLSWLRRKHASSPTVS